MIASIVDLIIAIHQKFALRPETLYLTISIIDRYLSLERVQENKLEVVGMRAFHLSCKYEEILAPEVISNLSISLIAIFPVYSWS